MFHHFHDGIHHHPSQGSLDANALIALVEFWASTRTILTPGEWLQRLLNGRLRPADTCLTFDDGLKCQFDIARPILDNMGLRAFWFIHSASLFGGVDRLETYRHFRCRFFKDMNDFYGIFFEEVERIPGLDVKAAKVECLRIGYLADRVFYSPEDRLFRYIRDIALGEEKYHRIMGELMRKFDYIPENHRDLLWMNESDLRLLVKSGHCVGLHSHTHPTNIANFGADEQYNEYAKNKVLLEKITKCACVCAAYPCGRFNTDTDMILDSLGIIAAFDCEPHPWHGPLHLPRFDHAVVWRELPSQKMTRS